MSLKRQRTCPSCGRFNPTTFRRCSYCRSKDRASEGLKSSQPKNRGLIELYTEIWNEREHVSFISGAPLYEFNRSLFAHVLAKGKYKALAYDKRNIVLLTPYEHSLLDHGTEHLREKYAKENPRCDWRRLFDLRDELLSSFLSSNH